MSIQNFKITAFSTALFSTWIFVEELGLLFDAGDGLSAGLMQKARKVKQVFLTHPDRDHLAGLLQFCQLNNRANLPHFYYPKDCKSFEYIQAFMARFDKHTAVSPWTGIEDSQAIRVKPNTTVQAIRNEHIPVPLGVHKSLSYLVRSHKRKLKPPFQTLNGQEIARIAHEKGQDFITEEQTEKLIGVSGDCPVRRFDHWNNTKLLIHEATFLEAQPGLNNKQNKHSTLTEVLQMASEINIEALLLKHFSSRSTTVQIKTAIRNQCRKLKLQIPVYAILPGEIKRDAANSDPIN